MASDIEDYLRGWRNLTHSPDLVPEAQHRDIAAQAFDQFAQFNAGETSLDACLPAVVRAARCSDGHVGFAGGDLLNLLAVRHLAARAAIQDLFRTGDRSARFTAIAAAGLPQMLPPDFVAGMLRDGLADPLADVRTYAAQLAAKWDVKSVLPEMIRMRAGLTDESDRWWVDKYIAITRQGYFVEPISPEAAACMQNRDGTPQFNEPVCDMTVRLEGGGHIGGVVTLNDLRRKGAAAIANLMREDWREDLRRRGGGKQTEAFLDRWARKVAELPDV